MAHGGGEGLKFVVQAAGWPSIFSGTDRTAGILSYARRNSRCELAAILPSAGKANSQIPFLRAESCIKGLSIAKLTPLRKRILKIGAGLVAVFLVTFVGLGFWVRSQVAGSLPQVDGEIPTAGLTAPVVVERDGLGIPTIRAGNRNDLAFATGFVHAQERFFQMDLLRRNSAGELAEIVGPAAVLDADRKVRVHRFRDVAQRVLACGD